MSRAFSLTTVVGALEATKEFIGGPPDWQALNAEQKELLALYLMYRDALPSIPSLESWAKRTAAEINAILAQRGFDIRLDEWEDNGRSFGTLSINDVTVLWPEAGREGTISGYPAFTLDRAALIDAVMYTGHPHPVLRLRTQGEEVVHITIHDEPAGPFELVQAVATLRTSAIVKRKWFDKVRIPMVHLKQMVNLGWLIGLSTDSPTGPWEVVQALQEVRFGMNEFGARVKEATAIGMRAITGISPESVYVVDRPFLIWFERAGVAVPTFQAYITEDEWKNPGNLSAL